MSRFASLSSVSILLCFLAVARIASAQSPPAPQATGTICATDGSSANIAFSTTSTQRIITTNMCPNHAIRTINPNAARQDNYYGVTNQQYAVPLKPQLASTANIINISCIPGPMGFMRSGAVMFSVYAAHYCGDDAVKLESFTFDECNGHSEGSGMYHYHMTPGCTLLSAGYTSTAHSPILGYMLDGIPVYGPLSDKGALPTDLDACGGHSSDSGNNGQYHYHTKPITGSWPDPATPTSSSSGIGGGYPYTPGCLRGCVDLPYLHFFSSQNAISYTSFADCAATGGAILSNVESITSPTAGPATTVAPTTVTTVAGPTPPSTPTTTPPTTTTSPQVGGTKTPTTPAPVTTSSATVTSITLAALVSGALAWIVA